MSTIDLANCAASNTEAGRPEVQLIAGRHKRIRAGHPWAYSNEIQMSPETKAITPGSIVALLDSAGGALGAAMFNPHPLISARMVSTDAEAEIDEGFLAARLRAALEARERLFDTPFYRAAWSEADGLPGLVLDRYGDVCVIQLNTAGMDRLSEPLLAAVDAILAPRAVVLKNDSGARELEGLDLEVRCLGTTLDAPIPVEENGVHFLCDPTGGQKTGWFFDHRENRARAARLASGGQTVLDVYSYLGGFGIQAATAGAGAVTCLDRSAPALALAEAAASLNGVAGRCSFVRGEAFRTLEELAAENRRFDIVIADPPAFVKSKKDLPNGLRGYRKLFRLAAQVVAPNGFLFVASCSQQVNVPHFAEVVRGALRDSDRTGRIVHAGGAAPDHPVHPYLPESAYLKTALLNLD